MAAKSNSDNPKLDLYRGTTVLLVPYDGGTRIMYRCVDSDSIKIENGQIVFQYDAFVGVEDNILMKRIVRSNLPYIVERTV